MNRPWKAPETPEPETDLAAALLADHLRDSIWHAAMTAPRSLQATIGPSEVGHECERRLAYRAAGTPSVHFSDPMRTIAGTGMHEVLANYFRRLDAGSGRYLVEHPVAYRGVTGSLDLYDRRRRVVIDWKAPLLAKARRLPKDGPQHGYVVQLHVYGTALRAAGEDVQNVALAYVPPDGSLDSLATWVRPLDPSVADKALDRWEQVRTLSPAQATPTPSRLCPWCPWYRPGTTDITTACPAAG